MAATLLTYLRSGRINDLPWRALILSGLTGLMFSLFAPLLMGRKNADKVCAWSGAAAGKLLLWALKVGFLFVVNTFVLLMSLFAAVSPGDVAPKVVDALSHYLERSADMILHP